MFTPNNDGVNDRFEIKGVDEYPGSIMHIYNRWGVLVHSSNDYNYSNFWEGSGHADGVYFYVFHLKTRNAKGKIAYIDYHGSVTLLRGTGNSER